MDTEDIKKETINMMITGWTAKKKFKCPNCKKTLVRKGQLYHCKSCDIDVQLKMKF